MSTHRYLLYDGRQVEINAPISDGRAYMYVDGEYLGENTIHELRESQRFTLADGSVLTIHVVRTIPFFRLFDLRHNGVGVRRSASDPVWSRRTAIDILIVMALSDVVWRLPDTFAACAKDVFAMAALLIAFGLWKDVDSAPSLARKLMLLRSLIGSIHPGKSDDATGINIDLFAFALYFWMRHLTDVIEHMPDVPQPTIPKMPATILTSNAP